MIYTIHVGDSKEGIRHAEIGSTESKVLAHLIARSIGGRVLESRGIENGPVYNQYLPRMRNNESHWKVVLDRATGSMVWLGAVPPLIGAVNGESPLAWSRPCSDWEVARTFETYCWARSQDAALKIAREELAEFNVWFSNEILEGRQHSPIYGWMRHKKWPTILLTANTDGSLEQWL
jgi:hypothetical protein